MMKRFGWLLFAPMVMGLASPTPAGAQAMPAPVAVPAAVPAAAPAATPAAGGSNRFALLNPADFVPAQVLPPSPENDPLSEALEISRIHALIAGVAPDRMKQAQWDAAHRDASLFSAVVGRDLTALPATMALLTIVMKETDAAIGPGKDYFHRARPYIADPTIHPCLALWGDRKDDYRSYPSGHSGTGYALGWVLARLLPDKAPQILARARDYALSREICGMHFHSDTEASHVLATLVAAQLLADPRLAGKVAAARAELTAP